jgi:ABC-type multidrug transport system ATPase subunit
MDEGGRDLQRSVLRDAARRRVERKRESEGRFESFYRVYIVGFFAGLGSMFGYAAIRAGLTPPLSVVDLGLFSGLLGLLTSLVAVNAIRTGRLGGPLLIPRPDIFHVFLAPVDRALALRPTVIRQSARAAALGALLGVVGGFFIGQGLPGGFAGWMASLGLFGALCGLLHVAIGIVTASTRITLVAEYALNAALVVIGLYGLSTRTALSPLAFVATWPTEMNLLAAFSLAVPVLLVFAFRVVGRLSLEAADRRTELVGASRVALVYRDLRAVSLLRRRMRLEVPRRRPWTPIAFGVGPVSRRDARGLQRVPAGRIGRLAFFTLLAGLCVGFAGGRIVFFLAAGLLHFLIAMDLSEGFAQEFDHPDLRDSYPIDDGKLATRHLFVAGLGMMTVAIVSIVVIPALAVRVFDLADAALVLSHIRQKAFLAPVAGCAAVLAAGTTLLPKRPITTASVARPVEFEAVNVIFRAVSGPAFAAAAMFPILALRRPLRIGTSPPISFGFLAAVVIAGSAALLAWFRVRSKVVPRFEAFTASIFSFGRSGGSGQVAPSSTPERNPTVALQLHDVAKSYDDVPVLGPVTLSVDAGEIVPLVGPNGAGKTTLLRLAAGLLEPSQGGVFVRKHIAGSLDARSLVSFVPDVPVFYDDLSLIEHIEFVCGLHGVKSWRPRADDLLSRFDLTDRADDLPARFSRGMKQKAALAIGLARPFEVLLLDEPLASVDRVSRTALLELLVDASGEGKTSVVATHDDELLDIATRAIAIRDGEIRWDGPVTDELRRRMA